MKRLLIKVCGLTRLEDVTLCQDMGADFTGFIFAHNSPRFIAPDRVAQFPQGANKRVGVFVGSSLEQIKHTAKIAHLDFIQLHNGEDVGFCQSVGAERVIKVLWPDAYETKEMQAVIDHFAQSCAYYLLDAGQRGGGSGKTLDWQKIKGLTFPKPWLLAGGLGAHTINTALETLGPTIPDGLDLNSTLEISPGIKEKALVQSAFSVIQKA